MDNDAIVNKGQEQSSGSATGNPRNKIALKPGRSLMDWIRLGHSGKDLTGVGGRAIEVTPLELAKHITKQDAWICLKGKVYNVTPYMEFHPGGEDELMKGVGKDATALFNSVHQWVNAESMLKKCLVGKLDASPLSFVVHPKIKALKSTSDLLSEPAVNSLPSLGKEISETCQPSWKWSQTINEGVISIVIAMSLHGKVQREDVVYQHQMSDLSLRVLLPHHIYALNLALPDSNASISEVAVRYEDNTSEIFIHLQKSDQRMWSNFERSSGNSSTYSNRSPECVGYHQCTLTGKYPVTHDTRLFRLKLHSGSSMLVPIGCHIGIKAAVEGVEVVRYYTPVLRSLTLESQTEDEDHTIYLMIKVYSSGLLTPTLDNIRIGEALEVSDHFGTFQESILDSCCELVLLAAGTGFTPMIRLLHWALFQSRMQRMVKLMFFNKEEKDILWRVSLDELAEKNPRLEVCYVLSSPHAKWLGRVGKIRHNLLEEFISCTVATQTTFVCICGPTSFMNEGLRILDQMKFPLCHIHAFQG